MLANEQEEITSKIIAVIEENIPSGFEKTTNYGMPSFVVPKSIYPDGYHCDSSLPVPFISIGSRKSGISLHHMGLYADSNLTIWLKKEWPKHMKTKINMGKGCIRFKNIKKIPYKLIGELVSKMTVDEWVDIYKKNVKN